MKVLFSEEHEDGGFKWQRGCTDISYFQNNFKRENISGSRYFY
jgi:hypothetical protein